MTIQLNRPTLFLAGTVLVLGLAVGGVTYTKFTSMQGQQQAMGPLPVGMLTLQAHPLELIYETQGSIQSDNQVDLKPEITGVVAQILFIEGQPVPKGAVLMRLQADKQTAQLMESAANSASSLSSVSVKDAALKEAQAEVTASRSRLDLAETEFRRYESLFKQQFVSELELAQKKTAFETAQADFMVAQKRADSAKAESKQARQDHQASSQLVKYKRAMTNDTLIRAPFSGVVGLKHVALGDTVSPGQKLVTMVQNQDLKVVFTLPERYLNAVKTGSSLSFTLESNPSRILKAQTVFIDPAVDAESRTLTIKGKITSTEDLPKPGQFAKVRLVLGNDPHAITVPEDVLIPQGEKFFVYVVDKDKSVLREVKTGQRSVGDVQILTGLKPGDKIVTTGLQKLSDGQPVMDIANLPKPPAEAAPAEKEGGH